MCAVGPSAKMFTHMVHVFERWNYEDPEGYEIFKDKILTAFDIAGRDIDKEEMKEKWSM